MTSIREQLKSQSGVADQPHYTTCKMQHIMYAGLNKFDWWQGNVTKYLHRWRYKNGSEDLKKALSYLMHYIHCEANDFDPDVCLTPDAFVPAMEEFYSKLVEAPMPKFMKEAE